MVKCNRYSLAMDWYLVPHTLHSFC